MNHFIADLHLHSTASDGEMPPDEVVRRCKTAGLETIALTDHDSVAGLPLATAEGKKIGLEVIAGCELTSYIDQTELHILSLFIDPSPHSAVVALIDFVRKERPRRTLEMTKNLRRLGLPLQDEDVLEEIKHTTSPGRAHIASALIKKGLVKHANEAFEKYLKPGAPAYLPKVRLEPKPLIEAIHHSGGIAILAHPAQYKRDELIPPLFEMGLDGLEVYHHSHSLDAETTYTKLAQEWGGVISGGSDYHGPKLKPTVKIRSSGATAEMLRALRARAKR